MKEQLSQCCKSLKLSQNIANTFSNIEASSNQEYLLKILQSEIYYREISKKQRLIKNAGFHTIKTFLDYDFKEVKIPATITEAEIKNCDFVDKNNNLILYGNVGTGKSHLSTAIGLEACKKGKNVMFTRTAGLVNRLSEAKKSNQLTSILKKLNNLNLLILDEWGYIPLDREGCQLLFQVVSECYEKKSIIITTNLEFSKWVNVFYDEQMTAAIIDRLIHHSHLLIFDGPSYRMKNSLMRT